MGGPSRPDPEPLLPRPRESEDRPEPFDPRPPLPEGLSERMVYTAGWNHSCGFHHPLLEPLQPLLKSLMSPGTSRVPSSRAIK